MKFRFGVFLLLFFSQNSFCQEFNLIPKPVQLVRNSGEFVLKKGFGLSVSNPGLEFEKNYLEEKIKEKTGLVFGNSAENQGLIKLSFEKPAISNSNPEGYQVKITPASVSISASSNTGIFYGIQTFLQLLDEALIKPEGLAIPALEIQDAPRFAWRGMMLDVSRHFFPKAEVMRFIDLIARYKLNVFHWHLSDDQGWRIEIKSYPKLTSVGAWRVPRQGAFGSERKDPQPGEKATYGGFYTQEEVREIVAYASKRGIRVVPEIDVPGHCMAVLASYPEFGCTSDTSIKVNPGSKFSDWYGNGTFRMTVDNSLNPSNEKVFTFLESVFGEMSQLFPSEYFHVGGDECYKGYWAKDAGCKALMAKLKIRHLEDLQGYFMNRVQGILKKKGKKMIGWDEIEEGGVSPEAAIMYWRGWNGTENLKRIISHGHPVVMSPTTHCYFDYFQGDKSVEPPVYAGLRLKTVYQFNPVPEGINPKQIMGGQANLWTENIAQFRMVEYMTFPRAWALSEVLWSPESGLKQWPDFANRCRKHLESAGKENIMVSSALFDPIVKVQKDKKQLKVELESEFPGLEIRYSVDESMVGKYSPLYQNPFFIPLEGAITLRVQAFEKGKPIGHLLTYTPEMLKGKGK
jgi:hexosaminidase